MAIGVKQLWAKNLLKSIRLLAPTVNTVAQDRERPVDRWVTTMYLYIPIYYVR